MRTGRIQGVFLAVAAVLLVSGAVKVVLLPTHPVSRVAQLRDEPLPSPFEALKPLHRPKTPPAANDWLASYPERGETLAEYLASDPVRASSQRRILYVLHVGTLTDRQRETAEQTADYLGRFFGLPVQLLPPLEASAIPAEARRINPRSPDHPQLFTGWVLAQLVPLRPPDALAVLALTGEDLFPDPSWNFVFGQAAPDQGVGVWSLHRFSTPGQEERLLARTLKLAAHELGHLLSVTHCPAYECVMNGSNHLEETDSRPLEPCPSCLAKLLASTGADPLHRYDSLLEFWSARQPPSGLTSHLTAARAAVLEAR